MKRGRVWAGAVVAAAVATLGGAAHAQTHDPVAAQALFDTAKALVKQGKLAEACPKLEESQRLDPAIGTHYALADCYEKAGRLASAWVAYLDVASEAAAQGRADREKYAKARAAALTPQLTRIIVRVPEGSRATGLEIKRDGEVLTPAQWGVAVPVDAGTHVVVATAPGKAPYQASVVAMQDGKTISLDVPALADAAPVAPDASAAPAPPHDAPPAPADEPRGLGTQRILALTAGGVGLAGIAIGSVFGAQAMAKHSAAQGECQGDACTAAGMQDVQSGRSAGDLSTVFFGVGAAALAGGLVLWLTAPSAHPATGSLRAAPLVAREGGGISVQGAW